MLIRSSYPTASGYIVVTSGTAADGAVEITDIYQMIMDSDGPVGVQLTMRVCKLNGQLVTDPGHAQRLADEIGLGVPDG